MVCAFLEDFPCAKLEHQWALLVAILEVADPYLLTDSEDSLFIGQVFKKGAPYAFRRHAEAVLEKRKGEESRANRSRNFG